MIFTIIGVTIYTIFVMFLSEMFYKTLDNRILFHNSGEGEEE